MYAPRRGPSTYLYDNRQPAAERRLQALADLLDPGTFALLDEVGVAAGWRSWEVGAGGPTVPTWLRDRVGSAGLVVATDIDTSRLGALPADVHVLERDVAADAAPAGGPFDLVHARLVLTHVPERERAVANMAAALRPGGWLVLEDADPGLQPLAVVDASTPGQQRANRVRAQLREAMRARGADLAFGRRLPDLLRSVGVQGVTTRTVRFPAGGACNAIEVATLDQASAALAEPAAELALLRADLETGRVLVTVAPLVQAWGRAPDAPARCGASGS